MTSFEKAVQSITERAGGLTNKIKGNTEKYGGRANTKSSDGNEHH
jgi:hypothetical protein